MKTHKTSRLVSQLVRALGLKPARARRRSTGLSSQPLQNAQGTFIQANRLVRNLTEKQRQEWRAYAATQIVVNPKTNLARPRQYDKVFVALTCRFLRCTPQGTPPMTPPQFPFAGDPISLTAQATTGGVEWTASGPTSPSVRVELLLQFTLGMGRTPQPGRYRTQAFASFDGTHPVETLCVLGGPCVPAYRFIHVETGQDTPLVVLPPVWAGKASALKE